MSVRRCDFCKVALVEWMTTNEGGRLPFDFNLVSPATLPSGIPGWLPGRWKVSKRQMIAMAPADRYDESVRRAAGRVATVHMCRQYLEHRAVRYRGVELIAA